MSVKDGGPAFPSLEVYEAYNGDRERYEVMSDVATGMKLRDYFAAHAPEATEDWIKMQTEIDRGNNPHGDSYKPPRRSVTEIRAQWRYLYADALLKAREVEP